MNALAIASAFLVGLTVGNVAIELIAENIAHWSIQWFEAGYWILPTEASDPTVQSAAAASRMLPEEQYLEKLCRLPEADRFGQLDSVR